MNVFLILLFATLNPTLSFAQTPKEIPFETPNILLKKNTALGAFQVFCKQRYLGPDRELEISFQVGPAKKTKMAGPILSTKTYNACTSYKAQLRPDMQLTLVAPPGERIDEPGSRVTTIYEFKKDTQSFSETNKDFYSPFKDIQKNYRKALAAHAFTKAEKAIVSNRKNVDAMIGTSPELANQICEDFHEAYQTYGEALFREKNYKDSFEVLFRLRQKFGDPQNIFFDAKSKQKPLVMLCQTEDSSNDQSEDHFFAFARLHFQKIEYIPYLIERVRGNLSVKTKPEAEFATQVLKFTSTLLKRASNDFQREHQLSLIYAWNAFVKDETSHPDYDRLIDEDTHLVFLYAETKDCSAIPASIIKRFSQKDDDKKLLKEGSLAAGNDYYEEDLKKSAIDEYKQYVQGRAILKKCDDIPKEILKRYFAFAAEQPYDLQ